MVHEKLQGLRASSLIFEDLVHNPKDKSTLCSSVMDVFGESKSALDYSMQLLKQTAYPGAIKQIYFPYTETTKEDLTKKFKNMKFLGIQEKHPAIFNFILKKIQPSWVKDFISRRNVKARGNTETKLS